MKRIISFIKNLQEADEQTKKKWLAIFSALSAAAVFSLWAVWFNYSFKSLDLGTEDVKNNEDSAWQSFSSSISLLTSQIGDWWATGNQLLVAGNDFNFIPSDLEDVPETTLP